MQFTTSPQGYDPKYYAEMAAFAALPNGKPTEVSSEVYWYFLNLMPPKNWVRGDGVERFMVCEPYCDNDRGTVYLQLCHLRRAGKRDQYFAKYVTEGCRDTYLRDDNLDPAWPIDPEVTAVYSYNSEKA